MGKKRLKIRKAKERDLILLEKELGYKDLPKFHKNKIEEQKKGGSLWLIAGEGKIPVAHVQLRFNGCNVKKVIKLISCPHVESLGVKEDYRKKGIATKLMDFVENLVKRKGYSEIGLSVEKDNNFLKNLYKKRGYKDWGKGEIIEVWEENGKERKEKCVYLIKKLETEKQRKVRIKTNWKVVIFSLMALGCLALMFITKEWLFIVPAVILSILNKRELNKGNKK
jgi:GNAT superfamily N-acetyltransferase